jgi:endonuclease/exonuclease/phosphatase family metal-dependent hydrolase
VHGPLVLAGDLNTSRFRPEFAGLLSLGFRDVHDALGKGLRPSFKLSNSGWLAKLGPLARLDHALTNAALHPVDVEELDANGSDHIPFIVTIAVNDGTRSPGRHRFARPHLHRRRSTAPVPEQHASTAESELSR